MALKYPDILEHNNPELPLVDITSLKGVAYPIGSLIDTGSIPSAKRNPGAIVFLTGSEKAFYGFKGQTSGSSDWDNPLNWEILGSGSSGGGGGDTNIIFTYYVSPSGSDATGEEGNWSKPFQTISGSIQQAVADAATGGYNTTSSLINVQAGQYLEQGLGYNGNFYFQPGAILSPPIQAEGEDEPLFNVGDNGVEKVNVFGYGDFVIPTTTDSDQNSDVIRVAGSGSVYFECNKVELYYAYGLNGQDSGSAIIRGRKWISRGKGGTLAIMRGSAVANITFDDIDFEAENAAAAAVTIRTQSGLADTSYKGSTTVTANKMTIKGQYGFIAQTMGEGSSLKINVDNLILVNGTHQIEGQTVTGDCDAGIVSLYGAGPHTVDVNANITAYGTPMYTTYGGLSNNYQQYIQTGVHRSYGSRAFLNNAASSLSEFTLDVWLEASSSEAITHNGGKLYLNRSLFNEQEGGNGVSLGGGELIIDNYKIITTGSGYSINTSGTHDVYINNDLSSNVSASSGITFTGPGTYMSPQTGQIINVNLSSSATSTASFGTYLGDGSQLTNLPPGNIPSGTVSGSAQISELGFVTSSATASFITNSQTSSMSVLSSSYADTASYIENAQTASYILANNIDQPFTNITALGDISSSRIDSTRGIFLSSITTPIIYGVNGLNEAIRINPDSNSGVILYGPITASGNVSSSAASTASFGHYLGDGSQLTNLPPGNIPSGTVSGSSQISELGFVTSSATASFVLNSQTSSMSVLSSSYALTASHALNGGGDAFPFTGSAIVSGSLKTIGVEASHLDGQFDLTSSITVTAAPKTSNHRYSGQGSPNGYYLNGIESPYIRFFPGKSYIFDWSGAPSHPVAFYLDAAQATQYTTGVSTPATYQTQISITENTPSILYYMCTAHPYMGNAAHMESSAISASYAITASHALNGSGFTPSLSTDLPARNITSSANISASGNLIGDQLVIGGGTFTSASLAAGGSGGPAFPFTGDAQITGSLIISSSGTNTLLEVGDPNNGVDNTRFFVTNYNSAKGGVYNAFLNGKLFLGSEGITPEIMFGSTGDAYSVSRITDGIGIGIHTFETDEVSIYKSLEVGRNSGTIGSNKLTVTGSTHIQGSGSKVLEVIGSVGTLFEVTDSLTGSIFAAKDATGIPILEVFANGGNDDTVEVNQAKLLIDSGSLEITGSIDVSGSVVNSLTASYAITASHALNSGGDVFPFTGEAQISGSLLIANQADPEDIYFRAYDTSGDYSIYIDEQRQISGRAQLYVGANDKNFSNGNPVVSGYNNVSSSISLYTDRGIYANGTVYANAVSASQFSGSFQGDGSNLTGVTSKAGTTSNRVAFTTAGGELTTEDGFNYNPTTDQLTVNSLNVVHFTSSFITSSTIQSSGSHIFGDEVTDTQTLVGSILMSGSANLTGSLALNQGNIRLSTTTTAPTSNAEVVIGADSSTSVKVLKIASNEGYVEIGPQSAAYMHFYTDLPKYYFNAPLQVAGEVMSHNGLNLVLGNDGGTSDTITIAQNDIIFELNNNNIFHMTTGSAGLDAMFSGSATSTASFGTYLGDGSQLTNLPASDPFPFTGDAQITGSLIVSGSAEFRGTENKSTNVVLGPVLGATSANSVIIGNGAGIASGGGNNTAIGDSAVIQNNTQFGTAVGKGSSVTGTAGIAYGYFATAAGEGIAIGRSATAATYGIAMGKSVTAGNSQLAIGYENTTISASLSTGHVILSGSTGGLELIGSGSTLFDVIGSQGTLFAVDDDLSGTLFTANDISGLPVLEASASGEVYIGKSPQSLYTTAVISSTSNAVTQSIFGLSTSSYDGAFFDYTIQSGSDARAGSIMAVWNGSNINFTETTTTDIGDTSGFNLIVHISQSQAQIAQHSDTNGYKIKTIIRSI